MIIKKWKCDRCGKEGDGDGENAPIVIYFQCVPGCLTPPRSMHFCSQQCAYESFRSSPKVNTEIDTPK